MSLWLGKIQLGNEKDGELSVNTGYPSYPQYRCLEVYSERYQGRVVKYAIRSLERDPYALGERGLLRRAGMRDQAKLWVLNIILMKFQNGLV